MDKMALHYPLNGVDLDFERYVHQPLGARDIFINRITRDLLEVRRIPPKIYVKEMKPRIRNFGFVKYYDRELALDIHVMWRLLLLQWPGQNARDTIDLNERHFRPLLRSDTPRYGVPDRTPMPAQRPGISSTLEEMIIYFVQIHHFQRDPVLQHLTLTQDRAAKSHHWKPDMIAHLGWFKKASLTHHQSSVFSGSFRLASKYGPLNAKLPTGPFFAAIEWERLGPYRDFERPKKCPLSLRDEFNRTGFLTQPKSAPFRRRMPVRSQSVPVTERWGVASLTGDRRENRPDDDDENPNYTRYYTVGHVRYVVFFPLKRLSELDKRSRRRSLSRSHIRAMFTDKKPYWIISDSDANPNSANKNKYYGSSNGQQQQAHTQTQTQRHPCGNCAQYTHKTKHCPSHCGYCGSWEHKAHACTMKVENRCKCMPFPQFHRSSLCWARCSRRCGNPHPPGDFRHKNAMLCNYRCCMCGARGHSGRKCAVKRCPCGRQHLTQDCRWKVECPAPGCSFYLCALHCRECGRKREKGGGAENAFVARTCRDCLGNGVPVSPRAT